jgi:hypothetical protein
MGRISPCARHHDTILELTRQGLGRHTIARQIGVSHPSLAAYMERRGLPSGQGRGAHMLRVDRHEVRRLLEDEHLTLEQTAERLGCTRSAIDRIVRSKGLETARTGPRSGQGHQEWKGGRILDKHGYIEVHAPLHPCARKGSGRVYEHRLVMEVALGRYLQSSEVVDHRDNHPWHNWPDNLRVYATNADHLRATLAGREKATPRSSIPGAYGSNQKIGRCPSPDETPAQCPSETRQALERYILIHRPTNAHAHLPKSRLLRSGALADPFPVMSTG